MSAQTSTRDRILEVALDRFLTHGHEQVSMRQVAAEVGVTPMAIYRHFGNKEELQLALLQAGYQIFGAYLDRGRVGTTARARLELLAQGFFDFAIEKSSYFEMIFLSGRTMPGLRNRDSVQTVLRPTYRRLHDCLADCLAEGDFPPQDARVLSNRVLAVCVGNAALYISGSMPWSAAEARIACMEAFADYTALLRRPGPAELLV